MLESSLIEYPTFVQFVKIRIIEGSGDKIGGLVVQNSFSVKLIAVPVSLVGDTAVCVLKGSFAMHFVVQPVAFVFAAFVVVENAVSATEAVFLLPLVEAFCHLLLNYFGVIEMKVGVEIF